MAENINNTKTAVVFGGTGLVGNELIKELIENQDYGKIIAVTRKDFSILDPKLEQLFFLDFTQLMQLKEELSATEYFCCIGTTIKAAGSQQSFRQVDLDIPCEIARLAETLSVPHLVVVSSMGADASSSNFYLKTKGEMEKAVREIYSGSLKFVRPSLLMGERKEPRFGESVAIGFMKLFGCLFIGFLGKYKGIKARDVAKAMIKIVDSPPERVFFDSKELFDEIL